MTRLGSACLSFSLVAISITAQAGRPLASDDAGTAEVGTCQLESWLERGSGEHAWVVAPACGIASDVELGLDYTRPSSREEVRGSGGLALKWVPQSWRLGTPVGELNFGLKLSTAFERPADASWRTVESGALALATLSASDTLTWHANLGTARERSTDTTAGLLNLALVWAPHDLAQLFVETQANNRRETFGGTLNSAGGRWWLLKDRLGLDVTASKEVGGEAGTLWTVGFGWYGLSW